VESDVEVLTKRIETLERDLRRAIEIAKEAVEGAQECAERAYQRGFREGYDRAFDAANPACESAPEDRVETACVYLENGPGPGAAVHAAPPELLSAKSAFLGWFRRKRSADAAF
jgi:hypothetical protein